MAGFIAASALCAAAQRPAMLVGARVLQGAMAATMIPQVLSIQATFAPGQRAVSEAAVSVEAWMVRRWCAGRR